MDNRVVWSEFGSDGTTTLTVFQFQPPVPKAEATQLRLNRLFHPLLLGLLQLEYHRFLKICPVTA
jgi:hypothetical protein